MWCCRRVLGWHSPTMGRQRQTRGEMVVGGAKFQARHARQQTYKAIRSGAARWASRPKYGERTRCDAVSSCEEPASCLILLLGAVLILPGAAPRFTWLCFVCSSRVWALILPGTIATLLHTHHTDRRGGGMTEWMYYIA